jgi:cytochrome c oxidase subunit 2
MDWHFMRVFLFLPNAASEGAVEIDSLHFVVISTTMLGAALVFMTALWFVFRYRRRGRALATPTIKPPTSFEIGHALFLLSLFIAFWVVGFVQYANMQRAPDDAIDVYVTGKQWMWKFAQQGAPGTIGYVVVPVRKPVRMVITSRDVVHSFYVPSFRLKRDAVPGRYTSLWFEARETGVFPVYCAEYCGLSHSRMAADVVVLPQHEYQAYLDGQIPPLLADALRTEIAHRLDRRPPPPPGDSVARGRELAVENACITCHTFDGRRGIGPSWGGLYGSRQRLRDGQVALVDDAYIARSIRTPGAQIALGFRNVMPTYFGERLDQDDIDDLIAFIKTLADVERVGDARTAEAL